MCQNQYFWEGFIVDYNYMNLHGCFRQAREGYMMLLDEMM